MINQIADAVTAAVNAYAATLDPVPFTAVRESVPRFDLKQLQTLRVSVVPTGIESEPFTRAMMQNDATISIGVMKKLDGETENDIDPLITLAENIAAYLDKRDLVSGEMKIHWISTEHKPTFSQQEINTKKVFTSVITMVYRVYA